MQPNALYDLSITKICSAATIYNPRGNAGHRDNRKRWSLLFKYEGETLYTSGNRTLRSDSSHPVLLPRGCTYEWQCTQAGHCIFLEFECDLSLPEPIGFFVGNGNKLLRMMKDLEYKLTLPSPTVHAEGLRDAYSILLYLLQSNAPKYTPNNKAQRLLPAMEHIAKHYNEHITNDTLASLTGVSTVYFRKLFTATMGMSPIAYVNRLRLEQAKELLRSDYGTLGDIAQSLGYASLYDFSRAFKRYTGIAPSKY